MAIEKILKQLTPERIEREIEAIQKIELPPELQKWMKEYEKVGDRGKFIFFWLYQTVQTVTLPIINKKYRSSLWNIKFLIAVFIILLDDVVDNMGKENLFHKIIKIPFEKKYIQTARLNQGEKKYLQFAMKLWDYIGRAVKKYPRYKQFKEAFDFDINQLINTMRYSFLVKKKPYLINKTEYWLYSTYSEEAMICIMLDLMCSPSFDARRIKHVREFGWVAQKLIRIGDCLSTWKREIKENDFTSAVIAYALDLNLLAPEELKKENMSKIVKKIDRSAIKNNLLKEWEQSLKDVMRLAIKSKIKNIDKVEKIFGKMIISHLSSEGRY
ncbi:MAG: hypothetical protein V1705_00805 [bacterium]